MGLPRKPQGLLGSPRTSEEVIGPRTHQTNFDEMHSSIFPCPETDEKLPYGVYAIAGVCTFSYALGGFPGGLSGGLLEA